MGTGLLTPAQVVKLVDKFNTAWTALEAGAGDGTFGASLHGAEIAAMIEGSTDASFADGLLQIPLNPTARQLPLNLAGAALFAQGASGAISSMSGVCARSRNVNGSLSLIITGLDSFAYYYNRVDATPWQCLLPPEWRDAFSAVNESGYQAPGQTILPGYPNPLNIYQIVKQGGSHVNAMLKDVRVASASTTTAGDTIDRTKYAGGYPFIKWSGGAGSGAVSITVTGKDQDGGTLTYTLTGTWGAGPFTATQAGVALVPSAANHLITEATSIAFTGITDGTFYVEAHEPSGRTYPTT